MDNHPCFSMIEPTNVFGPRWPRCQLGMKSVCATVALLGFQKLKPVKNIPKKLPDMGGRFILRYSQVYDRTPFESLSCQDSSYTTTDLANGTGEKTL